MSEVTDTLREIHDLVAESEYKKGYAKGRADAINAIHTDLSTEIALLNEADMTDANLYTFAVRIKEITDKLKEQK